LEVFPKTGVIELEIIGSIVGSQFGTIVKRKEFSVACTCGGYTWDAIRYLTNSFMLPAAAMIISFL
jgi:hypothetical protein